jgi:hypothetical protein
MRTPIAERKKLTKWTSLTLAVVTVKCYHPPNCALWPLAPQATLTQSCLLRHLGRRNAPLLLQSSPLMAPGLVLPWLDQLSLPQHPPLGAMPLLCQLLPLQPWLPLIPWWWTLFHLWRENTQATCSMCLLAPTKSLVHSPARAGNRLGIRCM